MFKLPLLWKCHVASLSKKKSTTTTKTPNELETESLSFQKYEISENIQYNKFFLFSISSIKLMLLYHVVPCPMTVSKSTASHCTVYSMESDANFTEQIFFV